MIKRRMKSMKSDHGSALIELALTLPLLACIVIGAVELGRVAYFSIELTNAARAGAAYGSQNPGIAFGAGSTAVIEQAAQNDAPDITLTWNTAPTQACTCETVYYSGAASTYSPSTPGSCTTTSIMSCKVTTTTSTQKVVEYIQVAPQATVNTIFKYPAIPTSFTLNGWAQMEVLSNGS